MKTYSESFNRPIEISPSVSICKISRRLYDYVLQLLLSPEIPAADLLSPLPGTDSSLVLLLESAHQLGSWVTWAGGWRTTPRSEGWQEG